MYRLICLLGVLLTLLAITAGSLAKFSGLDLFSNALPIHIKLAYAVAVIPVVLLPMAWWQTRFKTAAFGAGLCALLAVGLQVNLGISILKNHNQPLLLTGHLLYATVLLGLLFWLYLRSTPNVVFLREKSGTANFARIAIVALLLQIGLGSLVAVNQAGLVCEGLFQCNSSWWPPVDYLGAFNNLNSLSSDLAPISYDSQVALNWLHRVGALLTAGLLVTLMGVAIWPNKPKAVRFAGFCLGLLLVIQLGLGVAGYRLHLPYPLVVAHTLFAVLLLLPLVAISFYSRYGITELKKSQEVIELHRDSSALKPQLEPEIRKVSEVKSSKPAATLEEVNVEPEPQTLYLRLKSQLQKTRSGLGGLLANLVIGQKGITDELLEEVEASLLMADVGIDVTTKIINRLTHRLERQQLADHEALTTALKEELLAILQPCSQPLVIPKQDKPFVILVVGVNGVGKTTTIGKLAKRLKAQGHSVMLAAGDTFRAAAVEQLQTWGERNGIQVIAQHTGADSASVIFDGIQSAQAKGVDVLIADTAGRLHTKANLMEELKKVKRIMAKLDETAPHEVLLVLDAGTGQNALSQTKQFNETIQLTGLALTKLDGTAKGGVIFALAKQSGIPIRFIGVGEGIDDLQDFNAESFIDALFVKD
jgi:fused signal recognition particle receptor